MAETRTTLFADGILDASVTHGVARMTLAQTGSDGKPVPCGQLVVPLVQLPSMANSLLGLLKQVETRMKEQQQAASPEAGAPAPTVPGSFRFG
ncbi:MAG: hypothetical protein EON47_14580 [Acetobacteraceae bacterium]|nr:MAG: hypothetical protein EON47_14580 [Acetobacteraceae bacterium]